MVASGVAASKMGASKMVASRIAASCPNFEQVKNLVVILLTLNNSKTCKTVLGETGCLGNFQFLIHSYSFSRQSVRLPMVTYAHCAALVWLTGRHAMPDVTSSNFYLSIQSYLLLTQSVRLPMVTYLHYAALVWLMGRHATPGVTSCFPFILFTVSATDLRERFLLSGVFYPTLLIPYPFYLECYGFQRVFYTLRRFLRYTPFT